MLVFVALSMQPCPLTAQLAPGHRASMLVFVALSMQPVLQGTRALTVLASMLVFVALSMQHRIGS